MGGRDGKKRETDEGGQQQVVVMETAQIVTRLTSTEERICMRGKEKARSVTSCVRSLPPGYTDTSGLLKGVRARGDGHV